MSISRKTFTGAYKVVQRFTRDRRLIVDYLLSVGGRDLEGGTNQNEAIYQAADFLRGASNPDSRRVIIAITDDVSTIERIVRHPVNQTTHLLLETGSVVCGVFYESIATKPPPISLDVMTERGIRANTGIVKGYVERTGGVEVQASEEDINAKFTSLIARLRSRYSIGYQSSSAKEKGKFRRIKLILSPDVDRREGGVAVKTKRGYYVR